MISDADMRDAIRRSVTTRRFATFQDFAAEVPGFSGELGLFSPDMDSLILWDTASEQACRVLFTMLQDNSIRAHIAPISRPEGATTATGIFRHCQNWMSGIESMAFFLTGMGQMDGRMN